MGAAIDLVSAILVNPYERQVERVQVAPTFEGPHGFYEMMSSREGPKVNCIQPVTLLQIKEWEIVLWVDENACFFRGIPTFALDSRLFYGKALISCERVDEEGNVARRDTSNLLTSVLTRIVRWTDAVS